MIKQFINEFMWGYQSHFRLAVQRNAEKVLNTIGLDLRPDVFLVGVLAADAEASHPVCVDPEDGPWPSSQFAGLRDEIAAAIPEHPLQDMFYSHQRTMEQKPERIRRLAATEAVQRRMEPQDVEEDAISFCSYSYRVADYYVVVVVRMPSWVFREFPPLPDREIDNIHYPRSFIHACIGQVLDAATTALALPDPGEGIAGEMRSAEDIVRRAGSNFMHAPGQCWP